MSDEPEVTDEMLVAAMRAFERMSSVLRYREAEKWHTCDMVGMRDAIRAALSARGASSSGGFSHNPAHKSEDQMSDEKYPHITAAFINALAEEGTKAEAIAFLQKQWNENCALREENRKLRDAANKRYLFEEKK